MKIQASAFIFKELLRFIQTKSQQILNALVRRVNMRSKTIGLFLALGLATTAVACTPGDTDSVEEAQEDAAEETQEAEEAQEDAAEEVQEAEEAQEDAAEETQEAEEAQEAVEEAEEAEGGEGGEGE
ncbi:hypothetical protein [Lusitaniella coriacea]|uniref:hypothetical protein n=1 Tax=Lusitaniella coriacea TaxID=1983105 RepID=UPI003CF4CC12